MAAGIRLTIRGSRDFERLLGGECPASLTEGRVDCWLLSEDASGVPLPELASFLSEAERARHAEMSDPGRSRQFAYSRLRARQILGAYLGRGLGELDFTLNENGKPALRDSALEFNLSHTRGWLALAVAPARCPVGVDLERRREVSHLERIARKFFSSDELACLDAAAAAGASEREQLFFRFWSAKEALIKGQGGGVFKHVLDTELVIGPRGELLVAKVAQGSAADWVLHELSVASDVVGVLATHVHST